MRMLMKVSIPSDKGSEAIRKGTLAKKLQSILAELKPEAAYFGADGGKRTGYIFLDVKDPSAIPGICEPLFLSFGADIDLIPVMTPEDLAKAGPGIEAAVKKYGS